MIPVTVVSGFLGSGKTTLIRFLLGDPACADAALIVNEFGEAGIDHHLFRKTDERTTLVRGGCACCARRDDLADALRDLLDRLDRREVAFDRVVIETSGLADPAPILHTLVADPVLRHRCRADRLVVTLDAVAGEANLDRHAEAVRQVTAADVVVLTKRDLAPPTAEDRLRRRVADLNPAAQVLAAEHGRAEAAALVGPPLVVCADRPAPGPADGSADHLAASDIRSATLVFDKPLDWQMLGVWLTLLLHRHGERVLRVKGLLDVGSDGGPLLLEGVQHVVHAPRHLPAWPDPDRRSRIVLITRGLDPERLRDSLLAFQDGVGESGSREVGE